MDKNNPACYECPRGKNALHTWQVHRTPDRKTVLGANCVKCGLFLGKKWTEDMMAER